MQKFTEDQLNNIKIAKSISKFLGERSHVNQMLYLLSLNEYTISWQSLMKLIKKFDELNLDCPFYQEACDRVDAAVTTYDINKAFAEVAKAIRWYDLAYMSNKEQNVQECDSSKAPSMCEPMANNSPKEEDVEKMAEAAFEKRFGRKPMHQEADCAWLNTFIAGYNAAKTTK
jgi:hypothetical protein